MIELERIEFTTPTYIGRSPRSTSRIEDSEECRIFLLTEEQLVVLITEGKQIGIPLAQIKQMTYKMDK